MTQSSLFSLWFRVRDVWRVGAGLLTIETFVKSPSFSVSPQYGEHVNSSAVPVCLVSVMTCCHELNLSRLSFCLPKFCFWTCCSQVEKSARTVSFSAAAPKFLTYTPGLLCSTFQCEPLSVGLECIRFSIGNVVLKILAWLKVYTDRNLHSPPCDYSPSHFSPLLSALAVTTQPLTLRIVNFVCCLFFLMALLDCVWGLVCYREKLVVVNVFPNGSTVGCWQFVSQFDEKSLNLK